MSESVGRQNDSLVKRVEKLVALKNHTSNPPSGNTLLCLMRQVQVINVGSPDSWELTERFNVFTLDGDPDQLACERWVDIKRIGFFAEEDPYAGINMLTGKVFTYTSLDPTLAPLDDVDTEEVERIVSMAEKREHPKD